MDGTRDAWDSGDLSGHRLDVAWKMDPVLELWVDVAHRPTSLRLRGTLDHETGRSVLGVVEELLHDGHLDVLVDVRGLEVRGSDGFATLAAVEQAVRQAGGRTQWANWSDLRITADVRERPGEQREDGRWWSERPAGTPVATPATPTTSTPVPPTSTPATPAPRAPLAATRVPASALARPTGSARTGEARDEARVGREGKEPAGSAAKVGARRPPARRSRKGRVVPVTISGMPGGLAS